MKLKNNRNELIKLFINGELYLVNYKMDIKEFLSFLGISDSQIASNIFECNNKIILKSDLKETKLVNLSKLELVQVVGGG